MADEADIANERAEAHRQMALRQRQSAHIERGHAGECQWCGYEKERLVRGLCAPCRDELGRD